MSALVSELGVHGQYRVVPCCLCRSSWEERLVGVTLQAERQLFGSLCPRCLRYSPRQNATWLHEHAGQLRQAMAQCPLPRSNPGRVPETLQELQAELQKSIAATAQLQQMSALLRRGTRDMKNQFARTRKQFHEYLENSRQLRAGEFSPLLAEELSRIDAVLELGPQLLKLDAWQTTITDLMRAEKEHLTQTFALGEARVAAAIDRRYREFLSQVA